MSQNRNVLSRLEDFLQGTVEGFFSRVFRSGLRNEEVARKLERAMDENVQNRNGKVVAPNVYVIRVSPQDFTVLNRSWRGLVQVRLQDGLYALARQRNYVMPGRPRVDLEALATLQRGDIQIQTQIVDNPAQGTPVPGDTGGQAVTGGLGDAAPDFTQVIAPGAAPGAPPVAGGVPPGAFLVLRTPQGGQDYPLNRDVIHIGRHRTNDIVIREGRISRFHAEIRYERNEFVIYDLGSLNGVLVNNTLIPQGKPVPLRPGSVVTIGSYSFVFERR
jgi:hypothetical protein